MNHLLIKLIAGFVCTARWMMKNCDVAADPCKTEYLNSGVKVDCRNKRIHSVPLDLDLRTNILDLSYNYICEFTRESFLNYRSLKELLMTNLKCAPNIKIQNETFVDSDLLEKLDISNSPISTNGSEKFKWPRNLKHLTLHHSPRVEFQFLELRNLEIFEASNCKQTKFPEFHPTARLREIDLRNNNLSFITLEMVAQYCELQVLKISVLFFEISNTDSTEGVIDTESSGEDFYCLHQRLRKWAELKDIDGLENMICIEKNNSIEEPCKARDACDQSFELAEKLYNSCLEMYWNSLISILVAIVVLLVLILIIVPITWFLKKTLGIYKGRRSEIILDYRESRDFPSSYYEYGSEMESEIYTTTKKFSPKEFRPPLFPKKFSRKRNPTQSVPTKSNSERPPSEFIQKKLSPKRIPVQYIPEELLPQSTPTNLSPEEIPSQSTQR